jgi:serine/threonine-protein kinase
VGALLRRCLQKDPRQRLRDIGDARLEIEEALREPDAGEQGGAAVRGGIHWRLVAGAAAAALVLGAGVAVLVLRQRAPSAGSVARMQIDVSPARQLGLRLGSRPQRTSFALLPNGRALVFSGLGDKGPQLYLRSLERWEAVPITGTEGGSAPFLSPDAKWIGFYADERIKKVQIGGGTATEVCDYIRPGAARIPFGASWGPDDTIFFADDLRLLRVPAAGGKAEVVLAPDAAKGEESCRLPHVLPGGRTLLFTTQTSPGLWANPRVEVLSLETGARRVVLAEGADARYAGSGHLVFVRQGTLCAVPFDLSRLAVTGPAVGLIDDVMQAANAPNSGANTFAGQFSVSSSGTLAYVTGGPFPDGEAWLLWVDSTGAARPVLPVAGPYLGARLSPDGRSIACDTWGKHENIHLIDLERGTSRPLTTGIDDWPVWTPDGKRVAFTRDTKKILWTPASGSGEPEVLIERNTWINPSSWSPQGDLLAYMVFDSNTLFDIGILRIADGHAEPFLTTRSSETYSEFSPDGRWLAYVSDVSGQPEVYVESYPDRRQKIKISAGRGESPCWSRDGNRLYYRNDRTMMVVDAAARPRFGIPRAFLDCFGYFFQGHPIRAYDLDLAGRRLLATGLLFGGKPIWMRDFPDAWRILRGEGSREERVRFEQLLRADPERRLAPELEWRLRQAPETRINIVEHWFGELERLVPARKD